MFVSGQMLRSKWIQSILQQHKCTMLPESVDLCIQQQYSIAFDSLDASIEFLDEFDLPDCLTADFYSDVFT